jgi:hypothetical protein
VEIGAGAEAVTIRDMAKDFELSGERRVPGENRGGIKLADRLEDAVGSARAEGDGLPPREGTDVPLRIKGGIKEDSPDVDKLSLGGTRQARTKVKTRGASRGNSDVRAKTVGKERRENLVEEPKGMPSVHPEGGEGAVMNGGAGNGSEDPGPYWLEYVSVC